MTLSRRNFLFDFVLPLVVILLLSLAISQSDLDRQLAGFFYRPPAGWIFRDHWFWMLFYDYGMIPGLLLAVGGLLVLLAGIFAVRPRRWWRPATFLLLLALLAPGFLVHEVGKELWGRPRPVATADFGGTQPFHAVYQPAGAGNGKSFPSGHAAIGFYTIAPFFLLRRRRPKAAQLLLLAGACYGAVMGVGRMAQGGHYLTDVLWSAYLVHMTGMLLYYLLDPDQAGE